MSKTSQNKKDSSLTSSTTSLATSQVSFKVSSQTSSSMLPLQSYVKNNHLMLIVKPNAKKTQIIGYDSSRDALRIEVAAAADNNKANIALLSFLKKELGSCEIVTGLTSRKKLVKIL